MINRAVFLDRDGTIAKDIPYCRRPEDFVILPTVPQAIRLLNDGGFKVVVITNQSGIARGYFTEETLAQIHKKMKGELAQHGAYVDAIYYCPHHPDDNCNCRKPKPGLLLKAARDFNIDLSHSFIVGNMEQDIEAGKALGCKTILLTSDSPEGKAAIDYPDYVTDSLIEAAKWIIKRA